MFTLMKKYPNYIESLVKELQSSELANDILSRYKIYSSDPILKDLFECFSECQTEFFYSSKALSLLSSQLTISGLNQAFAKTFQDNHIATLIECAQLGLSTVPSTEESSLNTLWTPNSQKNHKSLKQLSFDVKEFVKAKGRCTYKEVADEIVSRDDCVNEKNIRRRVYDAINVLTAVNVFEKRGKDVCFVKKNDSLRRSLNEKKDKLQKVAVRFENLYKIILRNQEAPNYREAIQIPFFVVLAKKNVRVI